MAASIYLAMTAAEFSTLTQLPPKIAWMACHFSPYGSGLSNLPASLPKDSLLILNDRIPICRHSPDRIAEQLERAVTAMDSCGVLLDFQRPDVQEIASLASHLTSALPCPVAVSDRYAEGLSGPVFLAPCPHHVHLAEYIAPWEGRELWLDLARDSEVITLTAEGSSIHSQPPVHIPEHCHREENLHCHYSIENLKNATRFTLWRTQADLDMLAQEADALDIHTLVGLWREWYSGI